MPMLSTKGTGASTRPDSSASTHSYYDVFQQVDDFPLQPIIGGRYHDLFAKVDGKWQWVERDYTLIDLVGDLSHHLTGDIPQ